MNEQKQKQNNVIHPLLCTLSELYNGCTKKIQIVKREQLAEGGDIQEVSKVLTIAVKPGWKKGTRVVFPKEGDALFGHMPADIVFAVSEQEEASTPFKRVGDDLLYTHRISLADALLGGSLTVQTLDKRVLSIACPEIVHPTYAKVVAGEGFPVAKSPGKRGNLVVSFDIAFPKYLSMSQRGHLREVLGTGATSTD